MSDMQGNIGKSGNTVEGIATSRKKILHFCQLSSFKNQS
jgi:hypothetical protein